MNSLGSIMVDANLRYWRLGICDTAALTLGPCYGVHVATDGDAIAAQPAERPDLVTNNLSANATGWTLGSFTYDAGAHNVAATTVTGDLLNATDTYDPGQLYLVTYDITRAAGTLTPYIGTTAGTALSATVTKGSQLIRAAGTSPQLKFTGAGFTGTIVNVQIFPVSFPLNSGMSHPKVITKLVAVVRGANTDTPTIVESPNVSSGGVAGGAGTHVELLWPRYPSA
jgi:hypothetical protein